MNGAARWLPLVFVLALPAPALAHGPGPGSSLQQERPLPRFGDPRFPRLPDDNADYLMIETEDEDPIQWDWFPGGGVPESGTATGHIRLAYRRGSQAIQAVAHGITYRRSSPSASATETIALAGDVVLATPEGTLFSGRITVVVDNENYRVEAAGGLEARFRNQELRAVAARFDYRARQGVLEDDVSLTLTMEGDEGRPGTRIPERLRPILSGVDLEAQAVAITGDRFDLSFDDHGMRQVTTTQPVVVRLTASQVPEAAGEGEAPKVRDITITCLGFEANFTPLASGGSGLADFMAPEGIEIAYAAGILSAETGRVNLEDRELTFEGQVRMVQEGTTGVAGRLHLKYTDEGQIRLEASGRPTFRFSTSEFRPLAEVLNAVRPPESPRAETDA